MDIKLLASKAKILGIDDSNARDIVDFIDRHENSNDITARCGYCINRVRTCKSVSINQLACINFKFKNKND